MARYVLQSKYLQQLKENDELCSTVFEKSKYLMFSKSRPLLSSAKLPFESAPVWTPYSGMKIECHFRERITTESISEAINYCQDLEKTSVLLAIDESETENTPLFACTIDDADAAEQRIASQFDASFIDMRTAFFALPEEHCNLISRVTKAG